MADDRIEVEIVLDDGSIQKGFAKIRSEGKQTETSLAKNFSKGLRAGVSGVRSLTGAVFNLKNAFVGAVAVFGGAQFIRSITEAAAVQQDAVNQLNTSLATAGTFSAEASEGFQKLASELQAQSRFGDEVILQQAALARNYARSNEEAQDLIKVSIDLAEATGISLDSAVRNLGKTFSGLTGELGEAVPQVRGLTAEQLKAGEALRVLADRFGGAALGSIRTFSGATEQLSNTFGDFLEQLGATITQSPETIGVIKTFSQIFNDLTNNLKTGDSNFASFFQNVIANTITFAESFLSAFRRVGNFIDETRANLLQFELSITKLSLKAQEFKQDKGFIGAFLFGVTGAAEVQASTKKTIDEAKKNIQSLENQLISLARSNSAFNETFDDINEKIKQITVTTFANIEDIKRNGIGAALANSVSGAAEAVDPELKRLRDKVNEMQSEIAMSLKGNVFDVMSTNKEMFRDTTQLTIEQLKKLKDALGEFKESTVQSAIVFSNAIKNAFGRAVASGIQNAVTALREGKNALSAFANGFLSVIGDLAIQLGTMIIVASKALESLFTLNPAGGVLFGAALIAIGALLKGVAEGGGAAGSVPPAQDSVVADVLEDDISGGIEDRARVNVTIEGNVFDGDETGLRIADILKEQGFSNAVVS